MTRWLKAVFFRFLGYRALRAPKLRTALVNFQRATKQQPENLNSTIQAGWCLYKLENYEAAIEKYDQVLQRDAGCATAHAYRALALARVHRPREAIEELQRARRMGRFPVKGEKSSGFWEGTLGAWLADIGNHAEAIKQLRRSIELEPNDANTRCTLGIAYGELKRPEESIKELQESIRLDPTQPEAHYALAIAYSQSGEGEAAIETWKRIIEFEPNEIEGYARLALEFERLGRFQDALGAAREFERIAPSALSLGNVAALLNSLDRFDEALLKSREAIGLDRAYPDAHLSAGFALRKLGEPKAAIWEYQKAIELKPDDVVTLVNLGETYVELGRGQEGLALLRRAVGLHPDWPQLHDSLGLAHLETGNREEALKEFQAIQLLDPGFEGELGKRLASWK